MNKTLSGFRSGHLIDPQLVDMLDVWPIRDLSSETLATARELLAAAPRRVPPGGCSSVESTEIRVPAAAGQPEIRALLYSPPGRSPRRPAYLHIHGGGYVMGRPEANEDVDRGIAEAHDCVVVSPAYRLAPETVFPGAVEDCYTTLKWMFSHAPALGIDPDRIIIGGESAGGGLTAALALLVRDRAEVRVAAQMLAYPMLDDRTGSTAIASPYAGEFLWTAEMNRFAWASLLGRAPGGADTHPHAAAARADNVAGLPPAYLFVGALDLFFDENIHYARRLVAAGVPVELHVYPGAYHAFDMVADAEVSARYRADRHSAFARGFGR